MKPTLVDAISIFGKTARSKLNNPSAIGAPEDQLRAPFERLLADLAALAGFAPGVVVAVGESSLAELHTRPDYAATAHGISVGFVEMEPSQAALLERICSGSLLDAVVMQAEGIFTDALLGPSERWQRRAAKGLPEPGPRAPQLDGF